MAVLAAADIVRGDVLKTIGDVVAADVRLLKGALSLDKSMRISESGPIDTHTELTDKRLISHCSGTRT